MTAPFFTNIDMAGVTSMGFTNCPGKAGLIPGHGDEVNMVGHQTIRPDVHLITDTPLRHELYVKLIVFIFEKSWLPAITPLDDMVGVPRRDYPCDSCHGARLNKREHESTINMASPEKINFKWILTQKYFLGGVYLGGEKG